MGQRGLSNLSLRAFNAGEFSINLDARSDLSKYAFGSRILENANVFASGRWVRRQGMKLKAAAKYDDKVCRMIEFEFSVTTTFAIEMGEGYMRFYNDGEQVETSPGVPYEIATPYQEEDLFGIQFEGINDIVYFTHPDYQQRKLIRLGDTNWTFTVLDLVAKTAFLEESTDESTITVNALTGTGVTMTCSRSFFDAAHVGAYIKAGHDRDSDNTILPLAFPAWSIIDYEVGDGVTESATLYRCLEAHTGGTFATDLAAGKWTATEDISDVLRVQGGWTMFSSGFFRADVLIQQSKDGATDWKTIGKYTRKEDGNISASGTVATDGYLRIKVENWSENYTTDGLAANAAKSYARVMLEVESATVYGIAQVTAVGSPTSATVTVVQPFYATTATEFWSEGAWSDYQGWPRALAFHDERMAYAGTLRKPSRIWWSGIKQYEDFTDGTDADSPFSKEIGGRKQHTIEWMESQKNLLVGTSGGEFIVTTGSDNLAISVNTSNLRLQSANGSKHLRGISVNDIVLFVTRDGKKVRELLSELQQDGGVGYKAPDITLYAEHIAGVVDGGFTSIAFQQQPEPIVWATTAAGTLVSCTYNRDQDVIGWTRHPTQGSCESVAVITGPFRDEVWLSTKRTIDGATKRFIEQIEPLPWKDETAERLGIEDAFYVDCGLTYDGAATTTVSAPHLPNTVVSILADGKNQSDDDFPITLDENGEYELPYEASVIHVGLRYDTIWKPMRLDVDQASGDTMGQEKIVYDLVARFIDTVGCTYGDGDLSSAHPFNFLDFRDTSDEVDTGDGTGATLPFTGDKDLPWDGEFATDTPVIIKQTLPLPMTLIACVLKHRVTGKK